MVVICKIYLTLKLNNYEINEITFRRDACKCNRIFMQIREKGGW